MSEFTAALQELRELIRRAEGAGQRVFVDKINTILNEIENDIDELHEKTIEFIASTLMIPVVE